MAFDQGGGGVTAILEAKLHQQLVALQQAPLYQNYLDLRKAQYALDRGRTVMILRGYGVGPQVIRRLDGY